MATQKVPLTITYRHAGTQPPIFLAGEFSDPPWEPQEMDYTTDEDGEHTFKKEVFAEPGSKVQYKFRVGLGDWWVLNEDAPTAMDAGGFLNNVAEVPALAEPSTPAAVAEKARQIASGDAGNADSKSTEAAKPHAQEELTIANAAKELRHRPDLHSGTGTSTPEFARTAAEVADSAALLDKEDEEPYVANAAKELMDKHPRSGSGAGSGASTPSFVRTAAEVADSAALLDKEESEPEVTDEEAGRTGFRRLSSTPIQDVAAVAAEVADTAKELDRESVPQLEVRPAEYDDIDHYDFDEPVVSENKAPLFAHECVGMELYEGDDAPDPLDDEHYNNEYEEDRRPSTVYDDDEEIDLNDPTLERFPSNREEIIDTVRKLEGGLNEDHADVEGLVPLSPVVGPSGPQNHDLVGDFLVSSPAVSSPIVTRGSGSGSRLLSLPRASFGSINSDRASALSLDSISEAEEARDEAELDQPPVLSTPKPRKHPAEDDPKSPTSDDDEGIVMKSGSAQNGNSSEVSPSEVTPVRTPGGDGTPKTPPAETRTEDHHDSSGVQPEIKLVPASEATETQTPEVAPKINGERGSGSPRIVIQNEETGEGAENHAEESADTSAPATADTTKATGADNGAQSQLRRRVVPPDRVATPSSINEAHIQAAKSGNWFRSFFKVLFVDWIGGFINKLFGRKRETLLAAGAAGILIGVAWWRNTSK